MRFAIGKRYLSVASPLALVFAFAVSADALYRRASLLETMQPSQFHDAWRFLITMALLAAIVVTVPYGIVAFAFRRFPRWLRTMTWAMHAIVLVFFFGIHASIWDRLAHDTIAPWSDGMGISTIIVGAVLVALVAIVRRRYADILASLASPTVVAAAVVLAGCGAVILLMGGALAVIGGPLWPYAIAGAALLVLLAPHDWVRMGDAWQWSTVVVLAITLLTVPWTGISFIRVEMEREQRFPITVDMARRYPGIDHVIVISFDELAADRMSLYGNPRQTTPNLDALGKESIVFERMHAEADATQQSLAAMQTGVHYATNRFGAYGRYLAGEDLVGFMPRALNAAGWTPAYALFAPNPGQRDIFSRIAVYNEASFDLLERFYGPIPYLALQRLAHRYRFISFDWIQALMETYAPELRGIITKRRTDEADDLFAIDSRERPGGGMFDWARRYLTDHRPAHAYLRMHLYPPHFPYHRIEPFASEFLPDPLKTYEWFLANLVWNGPPYDVRYKPQVAELQLLYESYLKATDAEFGKFLTFLKESGLYDHTLLIVTADHGAAFAKGELFHLNRVFYEQTTRVPLLIHLPEQREGKRVSEFVQHVDLSPTVLDFLGVRPPPWMEGNSLRPLIEGDLAAREFFHYRVTFSQGIPPPLEIVHDADARDRYAFVAYRDPYKLIYRFPGNSMLDEVPPSPGDDAYYAHYPHIELFDLDRDPQETKNLAGVRPQTREELLGAIEERIVRIRAFLRTLR